MAAEDSFPIAEEPFDIGPWRVAYADDTGVIGSANGTDRSIYVNSTGMYVFRRAGSRKIQGIHAVHDEEKQLTVPSNASGSLRYDRVVDRLLADGTITTVLKTGTGGSGVPPALTQTPGGTWEESLGSFPVPAGATNLTPLGNAVTDERRFLPRGVTPVSSAALRPAAPLVGDEVDFPDGTRQRWTGSAWAVWASPAETWAPAVRSNASTWSLAVATGGRSRANGWVDAWSLATLGNNGPSFQPAPAAALPVYVGLPYAAASGYRGAAGTWGYVTESGVPVAAGELVVGYDAYEGAARLVLAGGILFTSNQWSLTCLWHYPAA